MSPTTTDAPLAESHGEPVCLMSVVIPCLNEAQNIEQCLATAPSAMAAAGIAGEVVVADNGSIDGSAALAEQAGAFLLSIIGLRRR
jgi:glycosyltransferase involved in cell wall biosynthesis